MRRSLHLSAGLALALASLAGGIRPLQADPPARESKTPALNPQVAALLKQAMTAYQKLSSYQHTEVFKLGFSGAKDQIAGKLILALQRPNKFCYRSTVAFSPTTIVSDGKTLTILHLKTLEYTRVAAPASYKDMRLVDDKSIEDPTFALVALMLQGDPFTNKDLMGFLTQLKPAGDVTEGGRRYHTLSASDKEITVQLYFDATTHLFTRWSNIDKQQGMTATEALQDVALNKPIKPSVFQFTPPQSARKVEKFTPTGP